MGRRSIRRWTSPGLPGSAMATTTGTSRDSTATECSAATRRSCSPRTSTSRSESPRRPRIQFAGAESPRGPSFRGLVPSPRAGSGSPSRFHGIAQGLGQVRSRLLEPEHLSFEDQVGSQSVHAGHAVPAPTPLGAGGWVAPPSAREPPRPRIVRPSGLDHARSHLDQGACRLGATVGQPGWARPRPTGRTTTSSPPAPPTRSCPGLGSRSGGSRSADRLPALRRRSSAASSSRHGSTERGHE